MLGRAAISLLLVATGCRQLFGLHLQSEPDASDDDGSDGPIAGARCNGDMLEMPDGQSTNCGWGCSTAGGPHCAQLVPSGGGVTTADLQPDSGLTDVLVDALSIDDTGLIVPMRAAGTGIISGIDFHVANGIAIYRFKDVTLSSAIAFTGAMPIALVAIGTMTIGPVVLDARGSCSGAAAGPGGFAGGAVSHAGNGAGGGAGGDVELEQGGGGGGGGFGATGGSGASQIGLDVDGGAVAGDAAMTTLIGGGGGGGGGDGTVNGNLSGGGIGGGGGGALQLVANSTMTIGGSINAGGCGGQPAATSSDGGGGGGAGGALLIEAPTIVLGIATLAVNGGGGGGEGQGLGQSGQLSRIAAQGGPPDGGAGGVGLALAGIRGNTPAGGGGGAIGRIRFETRAGTVDVNGATLSPSLSDSPTTAVSAVAATQ